MKIHMEHECDGDMLDVKITINENNFRVRQEDKQILFEALDALLMPFENCVLKSESVVTLDEPDTTVSGYYSLMCGPAPDDDGYGVCQVCQRLDCLCGDNAWIHRDDPETAAFEIEAFEDAGL